MKTKKWKKLLSYYKPYKLLFSLDMLCTFLIASISVIMPMIVRFLMNEVILWEKDKALRISIICVCCVAVIILISYTCNYICMYYGHLVSTNIEKDMKNEIFRHYQELSLDFFENRKIGELMSRVMVDLENISEFLHHFPEEIMTFVVRVISVFTILFIIEPNLAFIAIGIIAIIILYIVFFTPKVNKAAVRNKENTAKVNTELESSLSGIRIVKSFVNEEIEIQKFEKSTLNFVNNKKHYLKLIAILNAEMKSFTLNLIPITATIGIFMVISGFTSISNIVTFILYIDILIDPFFSILSLFELMTNSIAGYNRFIEILEIKPTIIDKQNAKKLENIKGKISVKNVSFKYKTGAKNILDNFSLEIKQNEYVALTGASGIGKSTLCNLISRFYDVQSGKILIDDYNVKDIKMSSLRKNIGMVQQDTYLFAGTIKENIAYGKIGATDNEIIESAKKANAHEFIIKLPNGYNTEIGQRGIKLSGGQKQRLSIARVFLKDPPILILDEATSSLDNESERYVQESLERLSNSRTTLVIAHRLSTIRKAERILVLDETGIVEEGTHEKLLSKNGVYAKLYNLQFKTL